jgi:hypothetical protein
MLFSPTLRALGVVLACFLSAHATADDTNGALNEVPFQNLSDRNLTVLGQAAMSIHPNDWKHAETTNFIYHYFHGFIAAPVSVEAEFYYRVIAADLEKDTTQWERKSHIFIFESDADWKEFQHKGSLEPWTGGIHSQGSLSSRPTRIGRRSSKRAPWSPGLAVSIPKVPYSFSAIPK